MKNTFKKISNFINNKLVSQTKTYSFTTSRKESYAIDYKKKY